MPSSTSIHLVGSLAFDNEVQVFNALASNLGTRAKRYPDGETGERDTWIRCQRKVFETNPSLMPAEGRAGYRSETPLKLCCLRPSMSLEALSFPDLGYAVSALKSYETFARLKSQGVIGHSVRFQVALPTPTAVVTSFIVPEEREAIEPIYEREILRELAHILSAIPGDELAIQWDVCHEILAYDGAFPLHYGDVLDGTAARLARLSSKIPDDVELGVHLCYGDPGHKHIQEPTDTRSAVLFANEITSRISRRLDWIHLPVPRDRGDDAFLSPLAGLRLQPHTELMLGLVHMTDGFEGTMHRVDVARKYAERFGVATECGFGRRDPATMMPLMDLHVAVAEAIDARQ